MASIMPVEGIGEMCSTLVSSLNSVNLNEDEPEKMNLELLDPLVWLKIIRLLDSNSRVQCRSLSRKIKTCVDYYGLHLSIRSLGLLESPDKSAWKDFIDNPNIYIEKVTIENGIRNPIQLGLSPQHQVGHLRISAPVRLECVLNVDWSQQITKLTFFGFGLTTSKLPVAPSVLVMPCLKHLYLCVIGTKENLTNQRSIEMQTRINANANASTLMRRIRSNFMETIFVQLWKEGAWMLPPSEDVHFAFAEFIQVHSKTLRTVVYHCGRPDRESAKGYVEFTSVPHGLKHFSVDFIAYCEPNSCWPTMLKKLTQLEEFTNGNSDVVNLFREGPFQSCLHNSDIVSICQMNYKSLKYVQLKIHINDYMLDLGRFSTCTNLEYFHLENMESRASMKNLALLPSSLKVLNIYGYSYSQNGQISNVTVQQIRDLLKFKNLLQITINPSIVFNNHTELLLFMKTILRLRKLVKIRISGIVKHYIHLDSAKCWVAALFKELCQEKDVELLHSGVAFELRLLVKFKSESSCPTFCPHCERFAEFPWKLYDHEADEFRCMAEQISRQMAINPEFRPMVLPSVQDIKLYLLQFKP